MTSISWNRINTGLLVIVLLGIIGLFASRAYGGPLDPPLAPAPTMKTLQQVEPRTPIDQLPFTISETGSYYLTGNLSLIPNTNGITVNANHVTIDLNGFQLLGPACGPCTGSGIIVAAGTFYGLTVRNGTLGGWHQAINATNARQGQFSDLVISGNYDGLRMGASSDARRVNASYNSDDGFDLGDSDVVADSILFHNFNGMVAIGNGGQILNNEIDANTNEGIYVGGTAWRVEGNNLYNDNAGIDVYGSHNIVVRNSTTQDVSDIYNGGAADYTPYEAAPTVTNPWSNVAY